MNYEKLFNLFEYELFTDDENVKKKGMQLFTLYQNVNENDKKMIDDVFIIVCGWPLATLIDKAKK